MLFTRLRDAATADERRRLAREMHDGVAQDIASLGYLVDALAAAPSSPQQAESLRRLRERITAVVSQVRLSVQTLRTDVQASESLGAAISGLARHLSDSSGIPIRVTVDERTARLRPEVEAELLRIAQESMTNAVRHSGRRHHRRRLPGGGTDRGDRGPRRRHRARRRDARTPSAWPSCASGPA